MPNQAQICEVAKERLLPWLAGQLDGTPEAVEFEEHVKQCPSCSELVSDRRRAMQVLLAWADAKEGVCKTEPTNKKLQVPSWKAFVDSKGVPILAGLAVILLGFSYFMKPGDGLLGEKALTDTSAAQGSETSMEETTTTHSQKATAAPATTQQETKVSDAAAKATQAEPVQNKAADHSKKEKPADTQTQQKPAATAPKPTRTLKHAATRRKQPPTQKRRRTNLNVNLRAKKSSTEAHVEVYDEGGRLIGAAAAGGKE